MEWQETTAINPSAWTKKVELSLGSHLEAAYGGFEPVKDEVGQIIGYTSPELEKACAQVRKAIAKAKGPQIVTVKSDGTATVEVDTNVMSAADRQAHEDRMEALRVYNSTEEQVKRAETTPEEAVIRDKILDEVAQSTENIPIEIVKEKINSAIVAHRQEVAIKAQQEAEEKARLEKLAAEQAQLAAIQAQTEGEK